LKNGNILFFVSILWIFFLFLSWDWRLVSDLGLSFKGIFLGDYWSISSQTTWLPLAVEISRGNFFPIDPFLGQADSAFRFFPYLSLWISGLLISIFGTGAALLIGSSIIPTLSYIFMVLIYRCFLNWRWSISLSALGILGFNSAPFREFLIGILSGGSWIDFGANSMPSASGFPFPAISLVSFLMVFYFSIQDRYMSNKRSIILSIAWGLQSQIHIINLIFGVPFWLFFLTLKILRSSKHTWSYANSIRLGINIFIVALISLPMVASIWIQYNHGLGLDYLSDSLGDSRSFEWFFIIAYCVIPLLILRIAYGVFRVDPYEIIFKFLPVWIAMSVELILSLIWQIFGIGLPNELLLSRLGLFFLHIFYFTPAIYCMHRPTGSYYVGSEALKLSSKIRSFLIWFFRDLSLFFLPIFLVFLTVFFLISSEKYYQNFNDIHFKNNQKSQLINDLLTSEIKPGELLIGPDNFTNLLLPIQGRYSSLWTNRIISKADTVDVIERFAVYAKVIGWSEGQFLSFMLPGNISFNQTEVLIDISGDEAVEGFGYWLTFHNNVLSKNELKNLSNILIKTFNSINLNEKLKEYGVKRIILMDELQHNYNVKPIKVGDYLIFNFY
jgi:hypothetical protein